MAEGHFVDDVIGVRYFGNAFVYCDKLYALDPQNVQNALKMLRVAAEKGDADRLISYGEKTQGILKRYKDAPAPAGADASDWERQRTQALGSNNGAVAYIQQTAFSGAYQAKDAAKPPARWPRVAPT